MQITSKLGPGVPSDAKAHSHPCAAQVARTCSEWRIDRQSRGCLRFAPANRPPSEETIPRSRTRQHTARLSGSERSAPCLPQAGTRSGTRPAAPTPHLGGCSHRSCLPRATVPNRLSQSRHAAPLVSRRGTGTRSATHETPHVVAESHHASPDVADRRFGADPLGKRHSNLLAACRRRGHKRRPGDGDFPPEPSGAKSILERRKRPCASCSHAGVCPST